MRKNIVILSASIHTFLINEVKYASDVFQRVVVICPYNGDFVKKINKLNNVNVEILLYSKRELYNNAIFSLYKLFEKEKIKEIFESFKKIKFTRKYFKLLIFFLAIERIFKKKLTTKLCLSISDSRNWVFYSAWYYGSAYAITEAKKKYKHAKTVSLAHSFEIDKIKNKYTKVLFRNVYHDRLDKVSFISQNVFSQFKKDIAEKLKLSLKNCEVRYLGIKKLIKGVNRRSADGIMRIVSCSYIVPIKRVDLIFRTLDSIKGISIEWVHFGDGSQMDFIKELIRNKKNENLNVKLIGSFKNSKIHKYYSNNPVDLFINLSKSEGIPFAIMEAIAYGIPVIATNVGGNSEIVKEGYGKLLSSNPSLNEIREAILSIYNSSYNEIKQMRKNASDSFEKLFNADLIRNNFFMMLKKDKNEEIEA